MDLHNFHITGWASFISTFVEQGIPIVPAERGVTCQPVVAPDGQRVVQVPHMYWEMMKAIPWDVTDKDTTFFGASAWGLIVMGVVYGVAHYVLGTSFKTPYNAVQDGTIEETIEHEVRVLTWMKVFMNAQRWPWFPKYEVYHLGVYRDAASVIREMHLDADTATVIVRACDEISAA